MQQRYQAVLGALDYVHIGICIALDDGTVIVANREADRLLEQADGVWLGAGSRLTCDAPNTQAALTRAIAECAWAAVGQHERSEHLLSVTRRSASAPLLMEIAPLRDSQHEIERDLAGALVAIIDPDNSRPFDVQRMAKAYGLTPAETAVCKQLVQGWTNDSIADARNVHPETVKSQVRAVMQKTGTKRRAELIRLVVKTSPPVGVGLIKTVKVGLSVGMTSISAVCTCSPDR